MFSFANFMRIAVVDMSALNTAALVYTIRVPYIWPHIYTYSYKSSNLERMSDGMSFMPENVL